jgi:hypothetical protein
MSYMHVLYQFRDRHTNDGVTLEADAAGRVSLTLEIDRAPARTLVLVDRRATRALGQALLRATDDLAQGLPAAVELEAAGTNNARR